MKTIWKWTLLITDEQYLTTPVGTQFLTAQFQNGELMVWGLVDKDSQIEVRKIYIVGTGNPMPTVPVMYIGTAQEPVRPFVWHVFVDSRDGKAR